MTKSRRLTKSKRLPKSKSRRLIKSRRLKKQSAKKTMRRKSRKHYNKTRLGGMNLFGRKNKTVNPVLAEENTSLPPVDVKSDAEIKAEKCKELEKEITELKERLIRIREDIKYYENEVYHGTGDNNSDSRALTRNEEFETRAETKLKEKEKEYYETLICTTETEA